MDQDLRGALQHLGLSGQEAAVYISTLKLGLAKASSIAQKSGMNRGGAYYTLQLLKERGFVSEVIKSGVRYYSAVSPHRIIDVIKEEGDRKIRAAEQVIPQLEKLHHVAIRRPSIEVYEGVEGFKTITTRILERGGKNASCYLSPKILQFLPEFHAQFRRRRVERGMSIRTLSARTKELEGIQKLDKKELRETRFYNQLFSNDEVLLYILQHGLVIVKANEKEQLGIYIEDPIIADLQKKIFDELWRKAEK
jgi:sugar-specific transcriptional regulator TrmB